MSHLFPFETLLKGNKSALAIKWNATYINHKKLLYWSCNFLEYCIFFWHNARSLCILCEKYTLVLHV